MSESNRSPATCGRCAALLAPGALEGLCPRCLMELNCGSATEVHDNEEEAVENQGVAKPEEASPPLAQIARHFPQLEVLEYLGRGGMGVVYKARQRRLNRMVALKILTPDKGSNAQFSERFSREAQTLARLNHPNIVAVYDFGEAGGLHFLLMEFVDGLSLRHLLHTHKLTPDQALAIVPEICEALQYAHDRGVVHRDIKPENILLDRDGLVKIADFGIAKIVSQEKRQAEITQDQQVIGTPHYMAPEQVEHPQRVDHRADIYSLGVVFYEMLTGELPLGRFAPPSKKAAVDRRLDGVVLSALEKEPAHRYQQASEVKNDVETIMTTPAQALLEGPGREAVVSNVDGIRPLPGAAVKSPWITGARWAARILGVLLLAVLGQVVVVWGVPALESASVRLQWTVIAWALVVIGCILGWRLEGTASLLIALGWALFPTTEYHLRLRSTWPSPLPYLALMAVLHAVCWWATHGRKTRIVAGGSAGVMAVLALAFLLAPAPGRLRIPARSPQAHRNLIDLTAHYNASLGENWMDPRDARDHLGELPTGVQRLAGTEFDVRGLIQVEQECRKHPPQVKGIQVQQPCRRLHFLHAARNSALLEDGLEIGRYLVHLSNGGQQEIPLVLGRELVDWHIQPRSKEAYLTAWSGENPKSRGLRKQIRLFKTTWENPFPEADVLTVDFVSTCRGPSPFLVALTAE
jgi:tRNA A-37 threonylcarbamoyl transferase component Bud32